MLYLRVPIQHLRVGGLAWPLPDVTRSQVVSGCFKKVSADAGPDCGYMWPKRLSMASKGREGGN